MIAWPSPFERVDELGDVGAWIEHGRRQLTLTLREPGTLFRNQFEYAWIDITEQEPMRGEPLRVWGTRRIDDGAHRSSFTGPAQDRLQSLLLPPVARAGFDRLWHSYRARREQPETCEKQAEEMRKVVRWWEDRTQLAEWYGAGELSFRRATPEGQYSYRSTFVVSAGSQWHVQQTEVMAEIWRDGEQVGWMTKGGELVPDGESLR